MKMLEHRGSRESEFPVREVRVWRGFLIVRFPDRELINCFGEPTGRMLKQYVIVPMIASRPYAHRSPGLARVGIGVRLAHVRNYGENCPHRMRGTMVRVA
jgi:hypothetical protein